MYFYDFKKRFLKDLREINKGNSKRFYQIRAVINLIIENPFSERLEKKKLQDYKKPTYRYYVGKNYRILVEVQLGKNFIYFLRVGKRENFY